MNDNRNLPLLTLALLLAFTAACAGGPQPDPMTGARSFAAAGSSSAPVSRPAAAPSPEIAESVARELPALRGVPGDDQLRTLKWMLRVPDERRLVSLFDDLNGRGAPLNDHAIDARQRVEALISRLEAAGHGAPESEMDRELAEVEANAPPPNWFPPTLIEELARHPDDPEAVRALEEATRVSPRGVEPPK
jgi:hypothetical protein